MKMFGGLTAGLLFCLLSNGQSATLSSGMAYAKSSIYFADFRNAPPGQLGLSNAQLSKSSSGPTDSISYSGSTTICSGSSITLTANYAPAGSTYQWTKDGQPISNAVGSSYAASASGDYSVIVKGTTTTNYPSVSITVNPSPTANFSFAQNGSCSNQPVYFANSSTGSGLSYSWNFGDPNSAVNTSTAANPVHSFVGTAGNGSQNFAVSLKVTNDVGCSSALNKTVTTSQLPDARLGGPSATTYNGINFFRVCSAGGSTSLSFINKSATSSTNSNYRIVWGDNSSDFQASSFSSQSHTYPLGTFTLLFIVTGGNGCVDTASYGVFVGSNPAVGLGNPGNTTICTGTSLTFPISGTESNAPGTTYTVTFNDGTTPVTFPHPAPTDITHVFTKTSCGTNSPNYNNSFSATIQASNPCLTSSASVVPIYVSQKPAASFTLTPSSAVCVNNAVTLTNTSTSNTYIDNGQCLSGPSVWSVSPASGWYVSSGTMGNDYGQSDVSQWDNGSTNLYLNFTAPGVYTITLKTGNPNCGTDAVTQTICVNPAPVAKFTVDNTQGCLPLIVRTTNTSNTPTCGTNTYGWSVTYSNAGCATATSNYSYVNGTDATSANPQFQFNNPGVYTISLITRNGNCGSTAYTQNVTVKAKPGVSLSMPTSLCQSSTIHPSASVTNCYATNTPVYAWSFPGGSPSSSSSADPGVIIYSSPGTYTVSLAVTNECGTTTATQNINVYATPTLSLPQDQSFCPGQNVGSFSFSATPATSTLSWASSPAAPVSAVGLATASGFGTTPSFIAVNNSSAPITATINVTANNNGCTNQQAFNIKVNPKPALPSVSSVSYCQNASAAPLTATALAGYSLMWYSSASGGTGSATAPTPATNNIGTYYYYVSQVSEATGCESNRATFTVTIQSTPNIIAAVPTSTTTCGSATGIITLSGLSANTPYTVSYTVSGVLQAKSIISTSTGTLLITGLGAGTYSNIFVTTSANCTSNSVGPVTISDPGPPTTPSVQSVAPLCSGGTLTLMVSGYNSSFTYSWTDPIGNTLGTGYTIQIPSAGIGASGTYSVTATQNNCKSAAGTVTVQVNPSPSFPSVTGSLTLCSGSTLSLTAASQGADSYNWSGPGGITGSQADLTLNGVSTTASGSYTVTATEGNCTSKTNVTVKVNATPSISSSSANPISACGAADGYIVLTGLTAGSYNVSYTKDGVVQALAGQVVGTAGSLTISKLAPGVYDHIKVSLSGCPSNEVGPFTLSDPNPPAVPSLSYNGPVCSGKELDLFASSATSGVAYTWAGPGGYTSTQQNPVIASATVQQSGAYTLTIKAKGCSTSATLNVTVNATPSKPIVVTPPIYCLQSAAVPLSATAASGNTLSWFDQPSLSVPLSGAPTPSTSAAGTFYYYVNQFNSFGCTGDTAAIPVVVLAALSGNAIQKDQTICSGGTPATIVGQLNLSGGTGSYAYQWQQLPAGASDWMDVLNARSADYTPGPLTATTKFRRLVASGPCDSLPSNEVTITVQGVLTDVNIQGDQTICAGGTPTLINGGAPQGGSGLYTYVWDSSADQQNWKRLSDTTQDLQPTVLYTTTYYRRSTQSGSCSANSSVVKIIVNPVPALQNPNDIIYCNGSQTASQNFTAVPSTGISYAWTNDNTVIGLSSSGTGSLPAFTAQNSGNIPQTAQISVVPSFTGDGKTCKGSPANFQIIVLPTVNITRKPTDTVVCNGANLPAYTPTTDAAAFTGSAVTYRWSVNGGGISLAGSSGNAVPSFTANNATNADLTATITLVPQYSLKGHSCDGNPVNYSITVKPSTPTADAGKDTILCAASSYTLQGNLPNLTTGLWSSPSSGVIISDPGSANSSISGLQPGNTYSLIWTLTGSPTCPTKADTVSIKVDAPLVNLIDNQTDSLCYKQTISIMGDSPKGGNGSYLYQWQSSVDSTSWKDIQGQTNQSLIYSPEQTVWVRRVVTSTPCTDESVPTKIIVQPPVSNNTIAGDQSVCIGAPASFINGSLPQGANGSYQYQWQQSTDGGQTWQTITDADSASYNPGVLPVTTEFKRVVGSNLCSGPQSSSSNVVTVTVNPDAKALLSWSADTACAPFALNPNVIRLQTVPTRNSDYLWYANNALLGRGSFPGYAINNSGDSVQIKLVAVSRFGCKNDSVQHVFYTRIAPQPAFKMSDTTGCGPLTVQFTNTTPSAGQFRYQWNFGNGQTSTAFNPPPVSYLSNPSFGDTTYQVVLGASSVCTTVYAKASVTVQSKPKALFAPNSSTGCSPMKVVFYNTSLGLGNNYVWDFGDGTVVTRNNTDTISHVFTTGVRDTFYVKLTALNGCGADSLRYAVVVSPNKIFLNFAFNGNEATGCAPHSVHFINNSKGATLFTWNFGDGTVINSTKNVDTLVHNFVLAGTYTVRLEATNGCSDTSTVANITAYPMPKASFSLNNYTACLGDSISFHNGSDSATSYLWDFGDGAASSEANPVHRYNSPGDYKALLKAFRYNSPGSVCIDSTAVPLTIVSSMPGHFEVSDSVSSCPPLTIQFTNPYVPSLSASWDFGDSTTASGDAVAHNFTQAGTYEVHLTVKVPGGCTYVATRRIVVAGPSGTMSYSSGYLCGSSAAFFQVNASHTDTLVYAFGDGTALTTTANQVYHSYQNGGNYLPSVTLKNKTGCTIMLSGVDTIQVDRLQSGFSLAQQHECGSTTLELTDSSHAFFGKAAVLWNFGDGTTGSGPAAKHVYTATGTYTISQIVQGRSGCADTTVKNVYIRVNSQPKASIVSDSLSCVGYVHSFSAVVQSSDSLSLRQWTLSNGLTSTQNPFVNQFTNAGNYQVQLVVGTAYGCYDTACQQVRVRPSPTVVAGADQTICRGSSVPLSASGQGNIGSYSWSPLQGLSCTTCATPVATPLVTTPYVVQATNTEGCSAWDTTVVTVIQPLHISVSPDDSICIGQSASLLASGATAYSWSPATGLSSTTLPNPLAAPQFTTRYRVVGYDGYNCFTDTAFVLVAIGQYPTVNLGPDLILSTGTLQPLATSITNGPIKDWLWTPTTDLSCSNCALPIASIKHDIDYTVKVTNHYGCSASDTLHIKVFCESAQVFIPNAFTPDGDGVNDILMVRGKGIVRVKTFRIFNRWGEVVFEKSNFAPNDPAYGWDGKVRGVVGGPDVYVYTAEVECENGSLFTYKGNVSIIK